MDNSILQNCKSLIESAKPVFSELPKCDFLMEPHVVWEVDTPNEQQRDEISQRQMVPMVPSGTPEDPFTRQRYTKEQFVKAQDDDPIIRALKQMVKEEEVPVNLLTPTRMSDIKRYYKKHLKSWYIMDCGCLLYTSPSPRDS